MAAEGTPLTELPAGLAIRPMVPADLPVVAAIDREAKPSPWSETAFAAELENPQARAVVLTGSGAILGYAVSWFVAGEIQIHTLAVHPGRRGSGLGELLLLDALWRGFERGGVAATLEVRPSNTAALALYHKYHFVAIGERPHYYRDNAEAALLMDLVIDRTTFEETLRGRWESLLPRLSTWESGGFRGPGGPG